MAAWILISSQQSPEKHTLFVNQLHFNDTLVHAMPKMQQTLLFVNRHVISPPLLTDSLLVSDERIIKIAII